MEVLIQKHLGSEGRAPPNIKKFWIRPSPQFNTNVEYKIDNISKTIMAKLSNLVQNPFQNIAHILEPKQKSALFEGGVCMSLLGNPLPMHSNIEWIHSAYT